MATLEIFGDIGSGWFGDGITSATVSNWLTANAAKASDITVRINSFGGAVNDGVAIYNLLSSHKAKVNVVIDGFALSAASVIAMAGDTITMMPGSMLMLHDAWGVCSGPASDMEATAGTLRKISDSLAGIYALRTGKDKADCVALMADETWLTAEQSVEQGFATALGAKPAKAAASAPAAAFAKWAKHYQHIPQALIAAFNAAVPQLSSDDSSSSEQETQTMPNNIDDLTTRMELKRRGYQDSEIDAALAYQAGTLAPTASHNQPHARASRTPRVDDAAIDRALFSRGFSADEIKAARELPTVIVGDLGVGSVE